MEHVDWTLQLRTLFPDLATMIDEHISYFGETLPHLIMYDVTQLILEHWQDPEFYSGILKHFEVSFVAGPPMVTDLIALGFLENLSNTGIRGATVARHLGPALREAASAFE